MCIFARAQYDAASIPAELKEGAHVVTRSEEIKYVVKDLDKATLTFHTIYTILDEEAKISRSHWTILESPDI